MTGKLVYAWVPGLPHILRPDLNRGYLELANACKGLAEEFKRQNVVRILYYSTQWLSVLGQSVQTRSQVSGRHVDENWYEIASLDFDFKIDEALSSKLVDESAKAGFQVRAVNYDGFPVDTGTIVANHLLNPHDLNTAMYSCCVYSDYAETVKIGALAKKAAETLAGTTAIVVVSGLSSRYFTTEIDYREDHIRDSKDDEWNKKILALMNAGDWLALAKMRDDYCRAAKVDMGLKALAFLEGAGACAPGRSLETQAYGAIYGTGAAVILGS
jgi:2-aminophenol/2-amino-5-chlorophenol 1,6-dioxygenase alpha subunit